MNDSFKIGFLLGLIVGEGSFTGDNERGVLDVKMNTIHAPMLAWMRELWGGVVYGPYEHQGRNYVIWRLKGEPLNRLMVVLDEHIHLVPDPKLHARYARLKKKWGLSVQFDLLDRGSNVPRGTS